MRKFEIVIENYEGLLTTTGGINVGYSEGDNKSYDLTLEDDNPVRFTLNDADTKRLLGIFEVGSETISLMIGGAPSEREYTVDIREVGDSHVFPTNPPIKFTKVPA